MPGPVVFGGFDEWVVVVEVEVELEVDVDVDVVVVVVDVVVGVEVHDSVTFSTGSLTGSEIDESGVPGGTLTVNVSFCPPTTVTVITHVSADAVGIAASAWMTSTMLVVKAATTRFRLLSTVVFLLPPCFRTRPSHRDHTATSGGRY